jgi:hypothetical protein
MNHLIVPVVTVQPQAKNTRSDFTTLERTNTLAYFRASAIGVKIDFENIDACVEIHKVS